MIVCDKYSKDNNCKIDYYFPPIDDIHDSLFEKGALTDEEYTDLRHEAAAFNEKYVLDHATTNQLLKVLDKTLALQLDHMNAILESDVDNYDDDDSFVGVDDDETTDEDKDINSKEIKSSTIFLLMVMIMKLL